MQFKLEVGGYETIFPSFEIHENEKDRSVIFNFINIDEKNYKLFTESTDKEIFLDKENQIISCRCIDKGTQFTIMTGNLKKDYFSFYMEGGNIGFSIKNKNSVQYSKSVLFYK